LTTQNTFIQVFRSVPGCQTCMCKRGINSFVCDLELRTAAIRELAWNKMQFVNCLNCCYFYNAAFIHAGL